MATVEQIEKILAAEISRPLKDNAGIIIPQSVDAHHRAAGIKKVIDAMRQSDGRNIATTGQAA